MWGDPGTLSPFQETSPADKPSGTFSGRGGDPELGTLWGLLRNTGLQEAFLRTAVATAPDAALQGASQKAEASQETTAAKSPLVMKLRCSKWDWEQAPVSPEAEHNQNPSKSKDTEPRFCRKKSPRLLD